MAHRSMAFRAIRTTHPLYRHWVLSIPQKPSQSEQAPSEGAHGPADGLLTSYTRGELPVQGTKQSVGSPSNLPKLIFQGGARAATVTTIRKSFQLTSPIGLKYTHFSNTMLKYKNSEDTPPPPQGGGGGVRTPNFWLWLDFCLLTGKTQFFGPPSAASLFCMVLVHTQFRSTTGKDSLYPNGSVVLKWYIGTHVNPMNHHFCNGRSIVSCSWKSWNTFSHDAKLRTNFVSSMVNVSYPARKCLLYCDFLLVLLAKHNVVHQTT